MSYNQITDKNFLPAKGRKSIPVYVDKYNAVVTGENKIAADTIEEKTSANGVVVDGVTLKDGEVTATAAIKSSGDTEGVGYATGAGATVEQATSRTTGVTINTVVGAITLVSAAGSTTPATFTVTNSAVAATDVIILNQKSGTDLYDLSVSAVAAGSFDITFNTKSGTTTEQPVINFAVIKGVTA